MKKHFFFILIFFISLEVFAQERSYSLGISISRAYFKNLSEIIIKNRYEGYILGLEYSETKGILGYRAGVFYTKTKDHYDPYRVFIIFDPIEIGPIEIKNHALDLSLSGQLYAGKKNFKFYTNLGLATTLNVPVKIESVPYLDNYDSNFINSLSLRGIMGIGFSYKILNHLGVDLGFNQRVHFFTFNNSIAKPLESLEIRTQVNYFF